MQKMTGNIFDVFHAVCEKLPKREIIFFKQYENYVSLTYQELYKKIIRLAGFLKKNGIRQNDHIAILIENNPSWPVSFLGILSVGAVAVPLNHQAEQEEINKLLAHSESKCILTTLNLYPRIKETTKDSSIKIYAVDSEEISNQPAPALGPLEETGPDTVASLVYTSGTTAVPKGVMLTHKNLLSNVRSLKKLNLISSDDCLIAILPFYHSYPFMVNLLLPLLSAARISFPLYVNIAEILNCINKTGVTVFIAVPRLFNLLAQKINDGIDSLFFIKRITLKALLGLALPCRKYLRINLAKLITVDLHSKFGKQFRFMASGGAKLDPNVANTFYKLGFTILEGYGLTETSPVASFSHPHKFKIGSAGMAVPGVRIAINTPDKTGTGEIIIKGDNVTPGYYKEEAITKIAIQNGWFFTGDVGYIDKDGFLFINNRIKEIIVLSSGKKINPQEVEDYYKKSNYIEEICLFQVPDSTGAKDLLSAVVLPHYDNLRSKGKTQVKDAIRWEIENLSRNLPSYKRIKRYMLINEKLPRTALGKLKRYAIVEKYAARWEEPKKEIILSEEDKNILAHPLCKKAYEYLCDKLNKTLALSDNLEIDLGLDSLEQIGLFIEFQQITGVQLEGQDLFNIFNVRDILNAIINSSSQKEQTPKPKGPANWGEMLKMPPSEEMIKSVTLKQTGLHKAINFIIKSLFNVIGFIFFRMEVKGIKNLPAKGPLIICPNHASYLDGPLLASALSFSAILNTYFLGLKAILNIIPLAWIKKLLRLIPIEARLDLTESLQTCAYILKNAKILCLFPEGKRSIDGRIQAFKKGLGILIKELDAPVIPVYIKGSLRAWPRHRILPRPCKIKVIFGNILSASELMGKEQDGVDIYKNIVHTLREELIKLQSSS